MKYYKKIKDNLWSLVVIGIFNLIFIAILSIEVLTSDKKNKDKEAENVPELKIGFYKPNQDEKEYFKNLISELKNTLGNDNVIPKYFSNLKHMCGELKDGNIDIAGELSPIEYVKYCKKYRFEPFLGIEYNNKSFYRSILFMPKDLKIDGKIFTGKTGPRLDYIEDIGKLIEKYDCKIAYLDDRDSTSGYYYALSFLIDNNINIYRDAKALNKYDDIYKAVLEKSEDHKFVAGFITDFRYDKLKDKEEGYTKYETVLRKSGEDTEIARFETGSRYNNLLEVIKADERKEGDREKYKDKYDKYYDPFIVDKSSPIPNGVFVISNISKKRKGLEIDKLVRLWKSVSPVQLKGGPKITGWRTDMAKDLEHVKKVKNKVNYYFHFGDKREAVLSIIIIVVVIMASTITCFILKKI